MSDNQERPIKKGRGGPRAGAGRPKGSKNKIPKLVHEMILEALEGVGGVDYFKRQARDEPRAFMALVSKIIPRNVEVDLGGKLTLEAILTRSYDLPDKESKGGK